MKSAWGLLLLCCTTAHAITWDFNEDGNAQGWYARESHASGGLDLQPLSIEVADGVMRVRILAAEEGKMPTALLVSPLLGYDSGLFDRVEARVRLVAQTPVVGRVVLSWTNARNRAFPGNSPIVGSADESYLFVPSPSTVTYTTQWQTIALKAFAGTPEKAWVDTLLDIRLQFGLGYGDVEMPQALEVDWIRLTGLDEQLQGEIPPPSALSRPIPGELFAPAEFQSLSLLGLVRPVLGDLDGDGRLDLVISSDHYSPSAVHEQLFATAYNDGQGQFRRGGWSISGQELAARVNANVTNYEGADLDGDGHLDLVVRVTGSTELLLNDRQGGFSRQRLGGDYLHGVVDLDQDHDLDIVLGTDDLTVLYNDGQGRFDQQVQLVLDAGAIAGETWSTFDLGQPTGAGLPQLLWRRKVPVPFRDPTIYLTTSLNLPVGVGDAQRLDASFIAPALVCIGDFNNDGEVDLGEAGLLQNEGTGYQASGLVAWVNQGNGHLEKQEWLPAAMLYHAHSASPALQLSSAWLRPWHLDADGVPDQVFVDINPRTGQNATVLLGRRGAMPVLEGQYALPGGKLGVADAGDIDGDGDLDLVVATSYAGGGVWVLRNQSTEQGTAITADHGSSRPAAFILGASYPNPFNPGTVIPLRLPTGGVVRVEILDLVGQQVCELQSGFLAAGDHRLTWDGRDAAGRPVAAGVYLCRAEIGQQVQVRKLVKIP